MDGKDADLELYERLTDKLSHISFHVVDINDYKYGDMYQNIKFVRPQVQMRIALCLTDLVAYAKTKSESDRDESVWRFAAGLANYDESTQETPRLLQALQSLYNSKLISKTFAKNKLTVLANDILQHDLVAMDKFSLIPIHISMLHGYPIYVELREQLGLKNQQLNELDIVVDSKVFKRSAHGNVILNNLKNISKLRSLSDESKISIWLFARQLTNKTEHVKILNTLVSTIKTQSLHADDTSFILGSWTSNPELATLDAPILDSMVSLNEFKSITTLVLADINIRTQTLTSHDIIKYKDGSSLLLDPVNQWLGKQMFKYVASGELQWFNIKNFPVANYPLDTLQLCFKVLTEQGDDLAKSFYAQVLVKTNTQCQNMMNLTGMSAYQALEAACLDSVRIDTTQVPTSVISDLFV